VNRQGEKAMDKEEKELLEKYRRLSPENRAHAMSNIRVALDTQETTKKYMADQSAQKGQKSRRSA
jgi:hypothetical protein